MDAAKRDDESPLSRETGPLDAAAFAGLMAPLEPFGDRPHLAVGVSGGADSLALALLARDWVAGRGGRLTALTVNHGLRPEAGDEARAVAAWMEAADIAHDILTWTGPRPVAGIQAAAREARLSLLEDWCRRNGVVDLMLAHHLDDQAETVLQRLGKGSGPDGLCGMAPVSYRRAVRVLRPLLSVPGDRTRATLETRGHPWIEDPSNDDATYQRVRLRYLRPALADAGLTASGLALTAERAAEARSERLARLNTRLAAGVCLDPLGFARVDLTVLLAPPDSEARDALGRVLACVGGLARPPRADALERLRRHLMARPAPSAGITLGRCHLSPDRHVSKGWLVCREVRHLPDPQPVFSGSAVIWDGRFDVSFMREETSDSPLVLGALGPVGWREVRGDPERTNGGEPVAVSHTVAVTLPALRTPSGTVCAVPQLRYCDRPGSAALAVRSRFAPRVPVFGGGAGHGRCGLHAGADGLCQ
ncbi:tRNA(Ile)-lysidine synthase [Rhodospira trueperi]|uniref:tRNA(Ile)-lysidine synthase n=1 Tax=Rhodospira trueperi TaxID=69960 RepID=A0A1G7B0I5_9PROT|nr:tRNA(Ile)-lysidine synthase [Rhodospira trueperi]